MPYIDREDRTKLETALRSLSELITEDGQLNYAITKLSLAFVGKIGGDSYRNLGRALLAMEAAKLEFYRRKVAPYEDIKSLQNGDVYG